MTPKHWTELLSDEDMQAEIQAKVRCYTERQQALYGHIIARGIETKYEARRRLIEASLDF